MSAERVFVLALVACVVGLGARPWRGFKRSRPPPRPVTSLAVEYIEIPDLCPVGAVAPPPRCVNTFGAGSPRAPDPLPPELAALVEEIRDRTGGDEAWPKGAVIEIDVVKKAMLVRHGREQLGEVLEALNAIRVERGLLRRPCRWASRRRPPGEERGFPTRYRQGTETEDDRGGRAPR